MILKREIEAQEIVKGYVKPGYSVRRIKSPVEDMVTYYLISHKNRAVGAVYVRDLGLEEEVVQAENIHHVQEFWSTDTEE